MLGPTIHCIIQDGYGMTMRGRTVLMAMVQKVLTKPAPQIQISQVHSVIISIENST